MLHGFLAESHNQILLRINLFNVLEKLVEHFISFVFSHLHFHLVVVLVKLRHDLDDSFCIHRAEIFSVPSVLLLKEVVPALPDLFSPCVLRQEQLQFRNLGGFNAQSLFICPEYFDLIVASIEFASEFLQLIERLLSRGFLRHESFTCAFLDQLSNLFLLKRNHFLEFIEVFLPLFIFSLVSFLDFFLD